MAENWDKLDNTQPPQPGTLAAFVANPLWDGFLAYMEDTYQTKPQVEYSGCGAAPGWNVKFKKSGRTLCTLYPEPGWFTALVVIGQREKAETELALPTLSEYTQALYHTTKEGMGQRWLMFRVDSAVVLEDVKRCVAIRRGAKQGGL